MAQPNRRVTLGEVLHLVRQLSPLEQVRLVELVVPEIGHALAVGSPSPRVSLLGLVKDLGTAPTAEEIDSVRREAWANFPRDEC